MRPLDLLIIRSLVRIERELGIVINEEETIVADIEQLTADFDQYKTDVTSAFARLQASLDAALANQGGVPADVQAQMDALDTAIQGADAEANAEDQPPAAAAATDSTPTDAAAEPAA